jgi:hypothetical protein
VDLSADRARSVRPSFVPPPPIRQLRDLTRYRGVVVAERGREIQRLEKTCGGDLAIRRPPTHARR